MAAPVSSLFSVEGRAAIVTGAAHGIGQGIAEAFIRAGMDVCLVDVNAERLEAVVAGISGSGRATSAIADVRDDEAVQTAVDTAVGEFGRVDVVVNNAGVTRATPVAQLNSGQSLDLIDLNAVGGMRFVRAALPHLERSPAARIINIASVMFFTGKPPGKAAYVASKGAVVGFTRAAARELGPHSITVNAIAPGDISTNDGPGPVPEDVLRLLLHEYQSIPRRGRVEDVAAAALFLASDGASFITGQTLLVDGGWAFG